LCRTPQRCVSIIAFGTYGDVARCGWEIRIMSNGKEMFRFAQHDKIPSVIASECNERGNQRAQNPE
ncbi:MAG: hypothetical protein K2N20_02585, partial [Helicobacter sp.]|nr:hypothetical protein [Helicobacter sp.]